MPDHPLKFKVAPHIVEDLGLNLYTDLPRVLVEYVANAHDADSPWVDIEMDLERIREERLKLKSDFEQEKLEGKDPAEIVPLAERTLPEEVEIVVKDVGCGMSRDELQNKFLIAGRRRRLAEPHLGNRTEGGRPLMGRKGLGKLAGFGVAKTVDVISRRSGEGHATHVSLRYEDLVREQDVSEVPVPDKKLDNGGGFETQGTRIVLSRLLYDPLKSRETTIIKEIGGHFEFVRPENFEIRLNSCLVELETAEHAFAWPEPNSVPLKDMVPHSLSTEVGEVTFSYRIRFVKDRQALPAEKRGLRVYVGNRLAALPSLLDMDTNMHGFRMTDYLDGVLQADFLDEQKIDYIATDRQSLRWDTPLLAPIKRDLGAQMRTACAEYQKLREGRVRSKVKDDPFTRQLIDKQGFSKRNRRLALKIATALASASKRSVDDPDYRNTLPVIVESVGHGSVLAQLCKIVDLEKPDLEKLVAQIAYLTRHELDHFASYAKTRLEAIRGLRRIVDTQDFKDSQNEKLLQKLFEGSPWLLNPTYTQFLTADQPQNSLFKRLAKELEIGDFSPSVVEGDDKRPDLVFLIGNSSLGRLVIVELKSANTPLTVEYLNQLEYYMECSEQWLTSHGKTMKVEGHLVGTRPKEKSNAQGAVVLKAKIRQAGPDCPWIVRDYLDVLEQTDQAHHELLRAYKSVQEGEELDDEY